MKELLNIAAKCDTMIGLAAIVVVCLTVLALAIFVLLPCVKMVLGTILNYHKATFKVDVASVNAELELHKKRTSVS